MTGPASPASTATASDAVISPSGRYRYLLTRCWEPSLPALGFVMLNPSTADHAVDDPTIRRCLGFARSWGFGELRVVNLFALRAAHPTALLDTVAAGGDPVGPENPAHLRAVATAHTVVLAWGSNASAVLGGDYPREVADALAAEGAALFHLGRCADGSPRHPLYLPAETPLSPWGVAGT